MLAYVFWHAPSPAVDSADYEARLGAFHGALRAGAPAGPRADATFALGAVPWLRAPRLRGLVPGRGLRRAGHDQRRGRLRRGKAPHDAAAGAAHKGVAGVMGHVAGPPLPARPGWAAWLGKPAGVAYDAFHAELEAALGGEASAWQRQMVLGPASEYCVLAEPSASSRGPRTGLAAADGRRAASG